MSKWVCDIAFVSFERVQQLHYSAAAWPVNCLADCVDQMQCMCMRLSLLINRVMGLGKQAFAFAGAPM
jgi:hypothetical protein